MGFLDKRSRIIDFKLTATGRDRLSRGDFNIQYYAFFDDEIDYDDSGDLFKISHANIAEAISNSEFACKDKLATVELSESNVKPYVYISKETISIKKQQQESVNVTDLILDDIVDVYLELEVEDFVQDEPLYKLDPSGMIPVPKVVLSRDDDDTTINGTDLPENDDMPEPVLENVNDINLSRAASHVYNSVLSLSEPQDVHLDLVGAKITDGFRIEVYWSGTVDAGISGSTNTIRLTEKGIDQTFKQYYNVGDSDLPDIPVGYGQYFKIITDND